MSFKCKIGFHTWQGCKCSLCGKIRDKEHSWVGCLCSKCGRIRNQQHMWDGCKCSRCGTTRDEEHTWDGCVCQRCGLTRDKEHKWKGHMCTSCNQSRYIGKWTIVVKEYRNRNYPKYDNDPKIIGEIDQISIKSDSKNLIINFSVEHTYMNVSDNIYQCYVNESNGISREYRVRFFSNTTLEFIQILNHNGNKITWTYMGTKNY